MSMIRLFSSILIAGIAAGCAHTPLTAAQNCHIEAGWLDSSNGCLARAGYPDCYRVCADGTRQRVGRAAETGDQQSAPTGGAQESTPPQ